MLHDGVELLCIHLELAGGGQGEKVAHDAIGAFDRVANVGDDHENSFVRLRNVFCQVSDPHENGLERVFHFVRNAGGECADGFHFFSLYELELGGFELFVRALQIAEGFAQCFFAGGAFGIFGLKAEVGLEQFCFGAFALGYVGGDAADGVRSAFAVAERELGRDKGA